MDTARLKHLVGLYWECRKRIDEIKNAGDRARIVAELLSLVDDELKAKGKNSPNQNEKAVFEKIYDEFLTKELSEIQNTPEKELRPPFESAAGRQLYYLEMKLSFIKHLLGENTVAEIERWERENILRYE